MTATPELVGLTRLHGVRTPRRDLRWVSDRLIAEFEGVLPESTVISHVARAREQLVALGVRRAGLGYAAEAMARSRLLDLAGSANAKGERAPRHHRG